MFKRVHPIVAEKLPAPKGVIECPKCGKRVRPAARKNPHEDSAECLAQVVVNSFTARGWSQVLNSTSGQMIEESGAPMTWALGGTHVETQTVNEFGKTEDVWVQHKIGFAPDGVIRTVTLLTKIVMPPDFRRRAIKALWAHEDLLLALDSARRLGAGKLKSLIHQFVVDAEQRPERPLKQDEERYSASV